MSKTVTSKTLRLQGKLCDSIIKAAGVEFPVHKIIMCKGSEYFRALFVDWDHTQQRVFTINGVSADIMGYIIDFVYTGSVTLSSSNIVELTMAADCFQMCALLEKCTDFLREQLCPGNCIGVWELAKTCTLPDLQNVAFGFICTYFTEVVLCEELLQLGVQDLALILDRDDLNVSEESVAFQSVMRWIAHRPEERRGSLCPLLSKVRLGLMTPDYIRVNVLDNELVRANPESRTMVLRALQGSCPFNTHQSEPGNSCTLCCPRLPNAVFLAIGGWCRDGPTDVMEVFDYATNWWSTFPMCSMPRPLAYHGTAFLDGCVYVLGGRSREEHVSSVSRFDPATLTWQELSPMHRQRTYLSVAILNGSIYAIGGFNGHSRSSTAERYQPHTNQWTMIAPMNSQRSDASCAALNNRIYICGGFDGHQVFQSAECYSPETNQWTMIAPMITRRSGVGVTAYMGHIYAVGGFDGTIRLHSAEAYNPVTNSWHQVSDMMHPRSNFGINVVNGRLYVVGGFSTSISFHVECYDAKTRAWSNIQSIDVSRSGLSCCVMRGLRNMEKFCIPRDVLTLGHIDDDEGPR